MEEVVVDEVVEVVEKVEEVVEKQSKDKKINLCDVFKTKSGRNITFI